MDVLFEGIREFNNKDYLEHQELFREIGREQNPHTLFIGCSDSRVVPSLITKTLPGELFIVRNIANIVPYYRMAQEYLATTSAIEYAVQVLNVENIVVCGHSNCGGCNALHGSEGAMAPTPHTRRWLELAGRVKERIDASGIEDPHRREWMTEQLNIIEQMNHLITYPYIKEKYRRGSINIYGWYYIIETGEVFNYDKDRREFLRVE